MSEQEKIDLLLRITESNSSKLWTASIKQKIFKQFQTDKCFLNEVKQAFVNQQLSEVNSDPLEEKVVDANGKLVASREWTCNARNCYFKFYRGNAPQLAIKPQAEDSENLIGPKKFVCLKHYCVVHQDIDYCHNYFKLYKKLPEGALLKISKPTPQPSRRSANSEPQPSTNLVNFETQPTTTNKSVNERSLTKRAAQQDSNKEQAGIYNSLYNCGDHFRHVFGPIRAILAEIEAFQKLSDNAEVYLRFYNFSLQRPFLFNLKVHLYEHFRLYYFLSFHFNDHCRRVYKHRTGNDIHGKSKSNISFELIINSIIGKTSSIRNKTIPTLLLRENIEANPGPSNGKVKPNLTLRTFNCNGLGDINKFRRVLTKLRQEVQSGGIAMLQETHIMNENLIKL
jgi:hypothetical protein